MNPDNVPWAFVKPAAWGGTLVLDLDGSRIALQGAASLRPMVQWLLSNGYAYGGTNRSVAGYDFFSALENLVAVRNLFTDRFDRPPRRTIAYGSSRGALVARLALERHPEIFDGALLAAGGGAGEIATFNSKLDGTWALKTLVDPRSSLKLVNIANEPSAVAAETAGLTALVRKALSTPAGRARLALAAAFEQFPTWALPGTPEPAPHDCNARFDQIAATFVFGNPAAVRAGMEAVAGGNVSWNHGVDYTELLARSGMSDFVATLYAGSGGDLRRDLRTLAKAPRIAADPLAVAWAEKLMTYTGQVSGPVVNVDNVGDPVDSASLKTAYAETLRRAGKGDLLRILWVRGAGHEGQTDLERLTGFRLLLDRLDTGTWGDTCAEALNRLASEIASQTCLPLGASRFIEHHPPTPLRTWDASNWGTYAPPPGA